MRMQSWSAPEVPSLPGDTPPLRLFDTATGAVQETRPGPTATMYVCGITPYDATHLGHAVTYLTYDTVYRLWRDAGHDVHYVQNVTDVDDPLLERAERDGEDWVELARRETALYAEDMTALRVLPPKDLVGAVEAIPEIVPRIQTLVDAGSAYYVEDDIYFSVDADPAFGCESHLPRETMLRLFGENGGDPDRAGKKNALDPVLWRAERPGEPSWPTTLGAGRPGWHIECTAIAIGRIGAGFDVQGGGRDLIFPHHTMSASHGAALVGERPFARGYVHTGMVGLDGAKMSKSDGNLVFVHKLRENADPGAVRLALLAEHYHADRDWQHARLTEAQERLARWRAAVATATGAAGQPVLDGVRARLTDDLDTPGALSIVDDWAAETLAVKGTDAAAPKLVRDLVDALLGVVL
jgi:L-cysteine:1D-myo-inositol 2-amino-2-deoxy-alpha-D-glucopyranoside ligase